jgi:hypothetical protein
MILSESPYLGMAENPLFDTLCGLKGGCPKTLLQKNLKLPNARIGRWRKLSMRPLGFPK